MRYCQPDDPRRQKILRDDDRPSLRPGAIRLSSLDALKQSLQEAIALEHFTIPPYLCALYSLIDGKYGPNREAYQIIRSVVMEEMLHMLLAANILNAIGGKPEICKPEFLPEYPRPLIHSQIGFKVGLLKFSKDAVNTFLRIERPAEQIEPPDPGKFWSIGQFYAAVREALNHLHQEALETNPLGLFTGNKDRQVTEEYYYGGGGTLRPIYVIDDANWALDEIVGQGEGIDGTIEDSHNILFGDDIELAHYFRFNEIFCERRYRHGDKPDASPTGEPVKVDWNAVYNMVPNPKLGMFAGHPEVHKKVKGFNQTYTELLRTIERACDGHPRELLKLVQLMYELANRAPELMQMEVGNGQTAGPSFEFIP
jgi:hypothetical protein